MNALQDKLSVVAFLTGPTASGKGKVGLLVARELGAEIISLDSMKVYRGMEVMTAKPPPEARAQVRHHLIDILDPWESFSLGEYVKRATEVVRQVLDRGKLPLFVGGTALYLKGLIEGVFQGPSRDPDLRRELKARAAEQGPERLHEELARVDPASAAKLHPNDLKRVIRALEVHHKLRRPISELQAEYRGRGLLHRTLVLGLRRERDDLFQRIDERVERMFEAGLVDEVEALLDNEYAPSKEARQVLGFKEVMGFLQGGYELDEARELLKRNTRKFAKRQLTWFKKMRNIQWLAVAPGELYPEIASRLIAYLENK